MWFYTLTLSHVYIPITSVVAVLVLSVMTNNQIVIEQQHKVMTDPETNIYLARLNIHQQSINMKYMWIYIQRRYVKMSIGNRLTLTMKTTQISY